METAENLSSFIVGSVPTLYYIPNFINDAEEEQLLNNIYQAPVSKWKSLKNRRLQNWGGIVHEKGLLPQDLPSWLTRVTQRIFDESRLFPSAINHVLINEYLPNQGIMPHQDGPAYFPVVAILSLGSPAVMDFTPHPNLGHETCTSKNGIDDEISDEKRMEMNTDQRLDDHRPFSIVLMPRSLLIFKDKAYSDYLHGIKDSEMQQLDEAVNVAGMSLENEIGLEKAENGRAIRRTATRVSLTCRVVTKVHRNLFKF